MMDNALSAVLLLGLSLPALADHQPTQVATAAHSRSVSGLTPDRLAVANPRADNYRSDTTATADSSHDSAETAAASRWHEVVAIDTYGANGEHLGDIRMGLAGWAVFGANGAQIGEVARIVTTDGVTFAITAMSDDTGAKTREIAVPLRHLYRFVEGKRLALDLPQDQLRTLSDVNP